MRVAVARPTVARANTAFEGELRCFEHLATEYDIQIDLIAREDNSLQTDEVNIVGVSQTTPERVRHLYRQGLKKIMDWNQINMPGFSRTYDVLLQGDYDVVETSDPALYPETYAAYRACAEMGIPLVPTASATKQLTGVVDPSRSREVVEYASAFLFVSPMVHDRYVEDGLLTPDDDRPICKGHPLDTELFSCVGSSDDEVDILTVGVLEERKGYRVICEAVKELAANAEREFTWHIVGSGELDSWIEGFVARNDLERHVTMHGEIPHSEINRAYEQADVFVLHSMETETWEEYFGVAYAEAMTSCLPVVGSESGAVPWVVRDGRDGILLPEGDVEGVTDALSRLMRNPELRTEMGTSGRENVSSRFEMDVVARKMLEGWSKGVDDVVQHRC